jgi:hypothetical protein
MQGSWCHTRSEGKLYDEAKVSRRRCGHRSRDGWFRIRARLPPRPRWALSPPFNPGPVGAAVGIAGAAIGTAGAIATAPFRGSYAYGLATTAPIPIMGRRIGRLFPAAS